MKFIRCVQVVLLTVLAVRYITPPNDNALIATILTLCAAAALHLALKDQ